MVDTAGDVKRWARSRLGTVIKGKYRLDELIGVGGMAVVFKATHRNQAEFAIKMLLPELSFRQDLKKRFLREGYAANSVKHAGVVQVVDDDETEEGAAFLVMELLHGKPVETLWLDNEQRLPVQVAAGIVDQLLDVLASAHAKGVVHRDLKPANLFLTNDGVLKVLDFGIARVKDALSSGTQGTSTGMMFGTPAFMAPEQAKAVAHAIDAQTDLWAVGATFFTLVTGRFVHDGENAPQLLINSATMAARSISSVVSHVPPLLAAVIDRALAFEKADRWPSAEEMRGALRQAYQTTYGRLPSRDSLTDPPSAPLSAVPPLSAQIHQHTLPLTPVASSAPPLMAGATTAQPISRQPAYEVPTKSRAPLWLALGGGGVVLSGVTAFALTRHPAPAASPTPDTPSATATQPATTATAIATPGVGAPSASATLAPSAQVSAQAEASAAPSAKPATTASHHPAIATTASHHPAAATTHAHAVTTAAHVSQKTPTKNCNPPYYFDAQNRKIFKKECL